MISYKMSILTFFSVLFLILATSLAQAGKQAICHVPPDDPSNWHTIVVSDAAVGSHQQNHGDLIGPCSESCEALCDDGDFCTQDVYSTDGNACICFSGGRPQVDCDDGNVCTADSCSSSLGACVNDTSLDDGDACDPDDSTKVCSGGECISEPVIIDMTCPNNPDLYILCYEGQTIVISEDLLIELLDLGGTFNKCDETTDAEVIALCENP